MDPKIKLFCRLHFLPPTYPVWDHIKSYAKLLLGPPMVKWNRVLASSDLPGIDKCAVTLALSSLLACTYPYFTRASLRIRRLTCAVSTQYLPPTEFQITNFTLVNKSAPPSLVIAAIDNILYSALTSPSTRAASLCIVCIKKKTF